MKVKKYTLTKDEINAGTAIEFAINFTDAETNIFYPKSLKFLNGSGATVCYLFLANDSEKAEADSGSTYYEYQDLPTSAASTVDLPRTQYIRLKKSTGTASADLVFYAINFSTWKR